MLIVDNIDIKGDRFVIVANYLQDGLNEILKDIDFKELLNGNFTYRDTSLLDGMHIYFSVFSEILRLFNEARYEIENISSLDGVKTDKDVEFVKRMMKISSGAEEHMFTTFQYLVSAIKR